MHCFFLYTLIVSGIMGALDVTQRDLLHWESFKVKHGKRYKTSVEEESRKDIFMNNLKYIREHNFKYITGNVTFTLGINSFADMTSEEFQRMRCGQRIRPELDRSVPIFLYNSSMYIPKKQDWRKKGAVTPVKNQRSCNAGWAFSATGSLEGQHFIKTKKLHSLSEQNIIDCSYLEGNHGCRTGMTSAAFRYIRRNGGIATEAWYPYTGKEGVCRCTANKKSASAPSYAFVPRGDEDALQAAIAFIGPISVAIDVATGIFHLYKAGVFTDRLCSSYEVNTGMLAVGYGSTKFGGDYYIVKSSLGSSWGIGGYMLVARNKNNMCGIASLGSYPLV